MANKDQLKILQQGVEAWNGWREENPDEQIDLQYAYLNNAHLRGANLRKANLRKAHLRKADLSKADLGWAILFGADLREVDLREAELYWATLIQAQLCRADLRRAYCISADLNESALCRADLREAHLRCANLIGANLTGADLRMTSLVETNLEGAILTDCNIYGISAWKLELTGTKQNDLVITPYDEPKITVDNLEVAQFIYLLLHNEKIRGVIDTIARKAVLILGRFTPERKAILDVLRVELRNRGYLPILFDFDKPTTKDFTETIRILAGMSLFVIADISNPKSSPLELQATIPNYMVPFVPIIQEGEEPFAMFKDLQIMHKKWVLPLLKYDSLEGLIRVLDKAIINPALEVHNELLIEKASELPQRHVRDYE